MKLKRLFKVIVLGGAALGAVKCGNSTNSNNDAGNTCQTDGGTDGGCGTQFW